MVIVKVVVGLGNPGTEHERDRHNAGFWLVDRIAGLRRVDLKMEGKVQARVARFATALVAGINTPPLKPEAASIQEGQPFTAMDQTVKPIDQVEFLVGILQRFCHAKAEAFCFLTKLIWLRRRVDHADQLVPID